MNIVQWTCASSCTTSRTLAKIPHAQLPPSPTDRRLRAVHREHGQHGPIALKLALTSYLLGLAVFIPISGWVADRVGAQTTFATAVGSFSGVGKLFRGPGL